MRKRQILISLIAIIHYQAFATNHVVSLVESVITDPTDT